MDGLRFYNKLYYPEDANYNLYQRDNSIDVSTFYEVSSWVHLQVYVVRPVHPRKKISIAKEGIVTIFNLKGSSLIIHHSWTKKNRKVHLVSRYIIYNHSQETSQYYKYYDYYYEYPCCKHQKRKWNAITPSTNTANSGNSFAKAISSSSPNNNESERILCTLSSHSGSVLALRFFTNEKYLASVVLLYT